MFHLRQWIALLLLPHSLQGRFPEMEQRKIGIIKGRNIILDVPAFDLFHYKRSFKTDCRRYNPSLLQSSFQFFLSDFRLLKRSSKIILGGNIDGDMVARIVSLIVNMATEQPISYDVR